MLQNRLKKRGRHLGRWAKRAGIDAYRLYHHDIPEIPLSVDLYRCTEGTHAVVAIFDQPHLDEAWEDRMASAIAEVLQLDLARIHLKRRQRQTGLSQYERLDATERRHLVQEDGLNFLVNFDDYLDTGLFLDHRLVRREVREQAKGKRVLNLFAYTGAFSVHAAKGGADWVTTIDMSRTYIEWAKDNYRVNDLPFAHADFIQADVLAWLDAPPQAYWDIAIVDPPTFSNSKRMRQVFDIQRDHPWLLHAVYARMRPGGVVYFSTNHRRFRPAEDAFVGHTVEITEPTMPEDFRNTRIHRAWRIQLP